MEHHGLKQTEDTSVRRIKHFVLYPWQTFKLCYWLTVNTLFTGNAGCAELYGLIKLLICYLLLRLPLLVEFIDVWPQILFERRCTVHFNAQSMCQIQHGHRHTAAQSGSDVGAPSQRAANEEAAGGRGQQRRKMGAY